MKRIIVAYDRKRGIGASNDMLWLRDLPTDQQRFKQLTVGSTLIMGRKTYESIGFPLPGRHTIVISRQAEPIRGVTVVSTLDEAYSATQTDDAFIAGGGEIYKLALDTVDEIVATEVQETFPQAEIFFPEIKESEWQETFRERHEADDKNKYAFDFVTYTRR